MEEFAQLSFPNSTKQSFASILLGKMPTMKQTAVEFPIDFCELLISLWSDCLHNKYVGRRNCAAISMH